MGGGIISVGFMMLLNCYITRLGVGSHISRKKHYIGVSKHYEGVDWCQFSRKKVLCNT